MAHLLFSLLALTVDQLLRIYRFKDTSLVKVPDPSLVRLCGTSDNRKLTRPFAFFEKVGWRPRA